MQCENEYSPIFLTFLPRVNDGRFEQCSNDLWPIVSTESGRSSGSLKLVQCENDERPIVCVFLPSFSEVKLEQLSKAYEPISVSVSGIVRVPIKFVHF